MELKLVLVSSKENAWSTYSFQIYTDLNAFKYGVALVHHKTRRSSAPGCWRLHIPQRTWFSWRIEAEAPIIS